MDLYLESVTGSILQPRVLDIDGQEYAHAKGPAVKFNVSYNWLLRDNEYSFEVREKTVSPVVAKCDVSKDWHVAHTALLFPHKLIYPENPTIQRGATIPFICHSSRPNWYSMNERVAHVSAGGYLKALKPGRSVVRCTDEIETSVRVVEFESISIQEVDTLNYRIQPRFSVHEIDLESLYYVSDLSYSCLWHAETCGNVTHEEVNGSHYCRLHLYDHRLCSERSLLEVSVDSPTTHFHLKGSYEVRHSYEPFGVPSQFKVAVSKRIPSTKITVDVAKDSIFYVVPPLLQMEFEQLSDGKTVIELKASPTFKEGVVLLEERETGERVEITVEMDRWRRWSSVYLGRDLRKFDEQLFYVSVVLTIILGGYIAYRMGAGALLPPLSPYATQ
jgi:hypothetical protein